jgi:hydroxymethylbilane synthase
MPKTIRIGTRGSELALWQANHVADLLREQYPDTSVELVIFTTKGDKVLDKSLPSIGGKGLFTEELETALLKGEIDCAVHSLKDLPTENPKGLIIGAVPKRASVEDVLVCKHGKTLDKLPKGAKIGTSSLRRAAQLRRYRPDFEIIDIRGNVPTRISKALDPDGDYDGIILARAGVERLELSKHITQIIPLDIMLPAPGQAAIGVQCRSNIEDISLFWPINDIETRVQVFAERGFLNRLEGGCSVPVAAYADKFLRLKGRVIAEDGQRIISVNGKWSIPIVRGLSIQGSQSAIDHAAIDDGFILADKALEQGAAEILAQVKNELQG